MVRLSRFNDRIQPRIQRWVDDGLRLKVVYWRQSRDSLVLGTKGPRGHYTQDDVDRTADDAVQIIKL